jgi:hypothetical protein
VTAQRDPSGGPTRDGPLCGSAKRGRPDTCKNPAGKGTDHVGFGHCRYHGGNSPGGVAMARREAAYATARTMHLDVDDDDETTPEERILGRVREQSRIVAWLREEVQRLTPDALIRSARYARRVEATAGAFPGTTTTTETGTQEHVLSQMYARERRIYDDLLAKVISLGIAKRHVELAKEQGELAGRLLVAVLTEMGVDPASPRAREVIRRQFTVIAGGAG